MDIRFPPGGIFRLVLEHIEPFIEKGNFVISPEGLYFQSLDSAHVAMVESNFPVETFEKFKCPKRTVLGLNLTPLLKILKGVSKEETVTLREVKDCVQCIIKDATEKVLSKWTMRRLSLDYEFLDISADTYDCEVKMPTLQFNTTLKRFASVINGDTIHFKITPKQMMLSTSNEMDEGEIIVSEDTAKDKEVTILLNIPQYTNNFSFRYLQKFVKPQGAASYVELLFNQDQPLRVLYTLPSGGKLLFFLAPKTDDDEA